MKLSSFLKVFIIAAAFVMTATTASYAQKGGYSEALSVDPVDLLVGHSINLTFEHRLDYDNSLTISGSYYKYNDYWSAFGLGASYRWYIDIFKEGKSALNGFSIGPMVRLSWWSWDHDGWATSYDGGTSVVLGGEFAYKWNFAGKWFLEPIVRIGFAVTDIDGLGYDPYGLGVNIGVAW